MPRHVFRLVLLIVAFALIGYAAKRFVTVGSFYEYGHYRGDSVAEIASDKPKYKGIGYCAPCHAQQVADWFKGVHNSMDVGKIVRCEVCHGAAGERDNRGMFEVSATGPDHPTSLKMAVPTDARKLCTLCHERLIGRPLQQRQIVVADHAGTQQCIVCHNPHSRGWVCHRQTAEQVKSGGRCTAPAPAVTARRVNGLPPDCGRLAGPRLATARAIATIR